MPDAIAFIDDGQNGPIVVSTANPLPVTPYGGGAELAANSVSVTQAVDSSFALGAPSIVANAPLNYRSAAQEASALVKNAPGVMDGIAGYNAGSAQFIQLHDATALPADGAVPAFCITVGATANFSIDFGAYGMAFKNGIVACNSSTAATKTIGSANVQFYARYK